MAVLKDTAVSRETVNSDFSHNQFAAFSLPNYILSINTKKNKTYQMVRQHVIAGFPTKEKQRKRNN